MDDDYHEMWKKSLELKKIREEKTKEISKNRLYKISKKKVQTTMIGALSSIEKYFAFLWGDENPQTAEQKKIRWLFEELRSEILDKGNMQIRNLENEFNNYDIVWKKNSIHLPFKGDR